jgi:hypothetical protein
MTLEQLIAAIFDLGHVVSAIRQAVAEMRDFFTGLEFHQPLPPPTF